MSDPTINNYSSSSILPGVDSNTLDAAVQKMSLKIQTLIQDSSVDSDVNLPQGGGGSSATPSLAQPQQQISLNEISVLIGSLMDKMISSGIKTSKTLIQNNMTQEISANNKALANIEKAIKHAAKAKKGGFWSKALGWAGVVAGAIVSVALMTNPVTFAAGAFLMASTIVGATTMAVSSTKAGQEFMKKNPWFATTMMVLQITLAVCSLGAGIYGAVSAASTEAATTAATTAAEESAETTATTVAEESAETTATTAAESGQSTVLEGLRTSASQWQTYATLAQAGIQAGKGGTDIYVGVQDGEAGRAQADSEDNQADSTEYQELVKDEIQRMSKLEKELYDAFTMVAEMQSGGHTTMSNVIKSMI